jgi:tetratricopeptide (TPR) repeat protein
VSAANKHYHQKFFRRARRWAPGALICCGVILWCALAGGSTGSGERLIEQGRYRAAQEALAQELKQAPDEAHLHYLMGRSLLAQNRPAEAMASLDQALALDPHQAAYHFWQGVAHWALVEFDRELESYHKALALDPDYLPAHVYAGHNYLDRGAWDRALEHYQQVLVKAPDNPETLYNAGIAYQNLGRTAEANRSWRHLVRAEPRGVTAVKAVGHLNDNGDFSYRVFLIERRWLVLPGVTFEPETALLAPEGRRALRRLGEACTTTTATDSVLHILSYVAGDAGLAHRRAASIRDRLLSTFPGFSPQRLRISWFDVAEDIACGQKTCRLPESVRFFTEAGDAAAQRRQP